jgi:hypothetical protein
MSFFVRKPLFQNNLFSELTLGGQRRGPSLWLKSIMGEEAAGFYYRGSRMKEYGFMVKICRKN